MENNKNFITIDINKLTPDLVYELAALMPNLAPYLQHAVTRSFDAYRFAKNFSDVVDIQKMQDIILKTGDAQMAYFFALEIPGANIEKLGELVGSSDRCIFSYDFARNIPGANIEILQKSVLSSSVYSYCFARDVPGADIKVLQKGVLKSPVDAHRFAKDVPGADIKVLQKVVLKHPYFAYIFARDIPGADLLELWEVVKDSSYATMFIENIKDFTKEKINDTDIVIKDTIIETEVKCDHPEHARYTAGYGKQGCYKCSKILEQL